ncbi:hypothetical protein IT396_00725 [Candidatus Nomurabacteria bacterium]|nr:hypothetical protein [Candidatus Nomurabacteria bacterium]
MPPQQNDIQPQPAPLESERTSSTKTKNWQAVISIVSGLISVLAFPIVTVLEKPLSSSPHNDVLVQVIVVLILFALVAGIVFGVWGIKLKQGWKAVVGAVLSLCVLLIWGGSIIYVLKVLQSQPQSFNQTQQSSYKVSSVQVVEVTPQAPVSGGAFIKLTRVSVPRIYFSYNDLFPVWWTLVKKDNDPKKKESILITSEELWKGGSGSAVYTFPFAQAMPEPGYYYLAAELQVSNDDFEYRTEDFYLDTPPRPKIVSYEATPKTISPGGMVTLNWTTENVDFCRISNSGGQVILNPAPANGSVSVNPEKVSQGEYYLLTCFSKSLSQYGYIDLGGLEDRAFEQRMAVVSIK